MCDKPKTNTTPAPANKNNFNSPWQSLHGLPGGGLNSFSIRNFTVYKSLQCDNHLSVDSLSQETHAGAQQEFAPAVQMWALTCGLRKYNLLKKKKKHFGKPEGITYIP